MRIELPNASASPPPGGTTPPDQTPPDNSSPAVAAPTVAARRVSTWERAARKVTSWRSTATVLTICVTMLGWALLIREPHGRKALMVMARSTPPARSTNAVVTAESLVALKAEQLSRQEALVRDRKEIPPLLAQLESKARQLDWHCERSLRPAIVAPHGISNLTLHPVSLQLTAVAGRQLPPALQQPPVPAFHRLNAWLDSVASLPRRAEIVNLELRADGAGLSSAEVKLHFYSANDHAEAAKK